MSDIKHRRIKIISDGTLKHGSVRIIDAETEEELLHVTKVMIRIDSDNDFVPIAEITIFNPIIEIDANVEEETTVVYRKREKRFRHE